MNRQRLFMLLTLSLAALFLAGCLHEQEPSESLDQVEQQTAMEHALKHTDSKYVCPMHAQIIRDEPGNCPICGMDLVKVEPATDGQDASEPKLLYYRNPMDPNITSDVPMKDSMGMDYVPVYETADASVKVSPAVINNMGVRTAQVRLEQLWRRIDTVGYVGLDEDRMSQVNLRTDGWIEQLLVKSEGEQVTKGDVLFQLYSPTLVNAQEEYLQALAAKHTRLINASRERLQALGVSNNQIAQLNKSRKVQQRLRIYAPQTGIVAKLNVREGMFVKPATDVMTLADLSSVWVLAEVFESQADWVRIGASADVTLSYLPGRKWEGKVDYIYPSLDAKTRTLKVRLRFDNPDKALKPNMFANVTIYGGARKNVLVIPREALIRTGQEARVIIAQGEGRFLPRIVTVGMESGDAVEIMAGLRADETVVTSGQFLIDSEASLKASILRFSQSRPDPAAAQAPIVSTAVVQALMPDQGKVKLAHEPIPAIDWPAMSMTFAVKPGVNLDDLKNDDTVDFELEPQGSDYRVIRINKQPPMKDMAMPMGNMQQAASVPIMAKAVIQALMPDQGKVKLAHEPIPSINWPAMSMAFALKSGVSLEGLKNGDTVMFELEKHDQGYQVVAIRKPSIGQ